MPALAYSLIAFVSDRDGDYGVFVTDKTGSGVRKLLYEPGRYYHSLTWAPHGRKLAFVSRQSSGTSEVYVLDVLEGHLTLMAPSFSLFPSWSGDGSRLHLAL
jgi:Tol biopolymer transport system component